MNLSEALSGLDTTERDFIMHSYDEPHRKYHSQKHLENMLRWIDSPVGSDADMAALVDAILYHDIVYAPGAVSPGQNEAFSSMAYVMATSSSVDLTVEWPVR